MTFKRVRIWAQAAAFGLLLGGCATCLSKSMSMISRADLEGGYAKQTFLLPNPFYRIQ